MRYKQANGGLPGRWAARLEELPGWRWLSGDDLVLLKTFALREGHTRVAEDHYEEGRPLGLIVSEWRQSHRKSGNWPLTRIRETTRVDRRLGVVNLSRPSIGWA
jgi:hypothetical protein